MQFLFLILLFINYSFSHELHWDWDTITLNNLYFPKGFLWGCADSAFQTEGIETVDGKTIENSWTEYEKKYDKNGQRIHKRECVGKACERWTRYKDDIDGLKKLGMNSYRFSIEWSKIEPMQGVFDQKAMQHYIDLVDELHKQNIVPMLTLFHHTYPLWFDSLGGFEKKKNIKYFVQFANYVFAHLHSKVSMWILLNEPIGYAVEGYFRGNYPPCKHSFKLAGKVSRNLLWAHVEIATHCKKINPTVKIGIAHIVNPLDVYHRWNPFEHIATKVFNYLINELTIDFFKTGKFNWAYLVVDKNNKAPQTIDFIGINYYTHTRIKQINPISLKPMPYPNEIMYENGNGRYKVLYPEGLYRAIQKASRLDKPIYITENGCATEDPVLRDEYIKKHLYVISKALQDGYEIQGYYYWTLVDCFCWRKGYGPKYGIYKVDFITQERFLRPDFEFLLNTIKQNKEELY